MNRSRRALRQPDARARRAPHQQRAVATVDAIVVAAERVLVDEGFARASTNQIAKRAGVSIGSLYQYFRDKEAIYRELVHRHRCEVFPVIETMLANLSNPRHDLVELTLELLRDLRQVNARNPRLMAAIDRELGWLEHGEDEPDILARVVAGLRARGDLELADFETTAALLVLTVSHLSRWLVHSAPEGLDNERFIARVGDMLRGLLG